MSNANKTNAFFQQLDSRIKAALADVPEIVGNVAVNYALDNFKKESYEGVKWAPRKSKPKRGKGGQPLLVQIGALRRSPRVISTSPTRVKIGSDIPYAAVHNNGEIINRSARSETFTRNRVTKGIKKGRFKGGTNNGQGFTFKAYAYKMPQRQFLGPGATLKAQAYKAAREHIMNALRG